MSTSKPPRLLLCGIGPLPVGNPGRLYATGLRLWGFAQALEDVGCDVDILEVRFGQHATEGANATLHRLGQKNASGNSGIDSSPFSPAAPTVLIAKQISTAAYSAVISTTDVMNTACAEACGELPLWCDFNGHPMAERQGQAYVHNSDEGLASQWDYILAPLLRADHFSTCSCAQRLALIGELGACGRLNRHTDGVCLVDALVPAPVMREFPPTRTVARGKLTPEDAFIVLWTGGYNTWADVDTLANGLLAAMRQNPRIHFVSTGGTISGHDEKTFERFRARIDESQQKDRFHFAGWVDTNEMANFYAEADIAINSDRPTLEGELGSRNRILEWGYARLPVLSTPLCEVAQDLAERGLIDTFPVGDSLQMANRILEIEAREKADMTKRADALHTCLAQHYSPAVLFAPLVTWATTPKKAPDLQRDALHLPKIPFAIPNNPLSKRRAQEYLQTRRRTKKKWFDFLGISNR